MHKSLFALAVAGAALAAAPASAAGPQAGAGFAEAWGHGTIVAPCATGPRCEKIATGTGTAKTFFDAGGEIGNYAFRTDFTVDLADSAPNGFGQRCFPVGGVLSIVPREGEGTLLLDIVGRDCALGASTSLSAIGATYVVDGARSTGRFAGASGVGTFNWQADASAVILSFSGNLHF